MFHRRRSPFEGAVLPTLAVGLAVLRIVTGLVFFVHGFQKLFNDGIEATQDDFTEMGVPLAEYAAPIVAYLELVGGVMLLMGLLTQLMAMFLVVDMLGALVFVHAENGFFVADNGIELVLLLGGAALALSLTGPGAVSVDNLLPDARPTVRWRPGPLP